MHPASVTLALVCLSAAPAFAAFRGFVTELDIVNKVVAPDGYSRSTVLAAGMLPAPLIAAQKGDDFRINLVNKLTDTSMDTHKHTLAWYLPEGFELGRWRFRCYSVPHQTTQDLFAQIQCGGSNRGPLVIYDPDDPHQRLYDVDDENTVIMLLDWYHQPSPLLAPPFNSDATLINGLGRYAGGPQSPLAVINVEHGKRYRFRIIGASCDPWFNFTIDGHLMTVIETDGIETEPLVVDSLSVFAAQRYSVVVTANQTVGNYWIRALSNHPNQTFEGGQSSAILRYTGAPEEEPTTEHGPYVLPYRDYNVHPLISPGAPGIPEPGQADININLFPTFEFTTPTIGRYKINGVSYYDPPVPVLLQILSGAQHASQLLPNGSFYELPPGKVVEISMPATELTPGGAIGGPHALHLHGHAFDVIRAPGSSTYNFVNPIRRDVISVGTQANNDNITFRFVTDNPGSWFLHCHIDFHLNHGFAVVMAEAPVEAAVQESQVVPGYWEQLCN